MTAGDLARMDAEKFKGQRSALLTFAAKHPGALTAHFLSQVRSRLKGPAGRMTQTRHLRDCSVLEWAQSGHAGVTEIRDLREVYTLSTILDAVNRDDLSQAMDVLVMRLHALAAAKRKGGTWDAAQKLELIPTTAGDLLPPGLAGVAS